MVSLGSGDFRLLTIKSLEVLKNSDIICVPTKSKDSFEKSRSYVIVSDALKYLGIKRELKAIYSPMKLKTEDWDRQSDEILECFDKSSRVSFVTLGDASIYSSVYYILEFIRDKNIEIFNNTEITEGITSFSSASAKIKKPLCLGNSRLVVEPFHSSKDTETTTVFMRPNRGDLLDKFDEDITIFENLNFTDEVIYSSKIDRVKKYMTLIIDFFKK